jgi:hypothetical protein
LAQIHTAPGPASVILKQFVHRLVAILKMISASESTRGNVFRRAQQIERQARGRLGADPRQAFEGINQVLRRVRADWP